MPRWGAEPSTETLQEKVYKHRPCSIPWLSLGPLASSSSFRWDFRWSGDGFTPVTTRGGWELAEYTMHVHACVYARARARTHTVSPVAYPNNNRRLMHTETPFWNKDPWINRASVCPSITAQFCPVWAHLGGKKRKQASLPQAKDIPVSERIKTHLTCWILYSKNTEYTVKKKGIWNQKTRIFEVLVRPHQLHGHAQVLLCLNLLFLRV